MPDNVCYEPAQTCRLIQKGKQPQSSNSSSQNKWSTNITEINIQWQCFVLSMFWSWSKGKGTFLLVFLSLTCAVIHWAIFRRFCTVVFVPPIYCPELCVFLTPSIFFSLTQRAKCASWRHSCKVRFPWLPQANQWAQMLPKTLRPCAGANAPALDGRVRKRKRGKEEAWAQEIEGTEELERRETGEKPVGQTGYNSYNWSWNFTLEIMHLYKKVWIHLLWYAVL